MASGRILLTQAAARHRRDATRSAGRQSPPVLLSRLGAHVVDLIANPGSVTSDAAADTRVVAVAFVRGRAEQTVIARRALRRLSTPGLRSLHVTEGRDKLG